LKKSVLKNQLITNSYIDFCRVLIRKEQETGLKTNPVRPDGLHWCDRSIFNGGYPVFIINKAPYPFVEIRLKKNWCITATFFF